MNRPIQIRALTEQEIAELTHSATFNALHPVRCMQCGNTHAFGRKMFWIGGVPKAEQHSDSTQGVIAHHLKERYNIASVFFKTDRNRFYVDSAICKYLPPCRKHELLVLRAYCHAVNGSRWTMVSFRHGDQT
jgi:hypothetical protein